MPCAVRRGEKLERFRAEQNDQHNDGCPHHPEYEIASLKKLQQLIQTMRRLPYSAKYSYQNCTNADQDRTDKGISGKRFAEDQGREDRVENQPRLSLGLASLYRLLQKKRRLTA
jgi:hypothetical protein